MLIVFSGNTSWSMYNFRLGLMKQFLHFGYEVCVVAPADEYTDKIIAAGIRFVPVNNLIRAGSNPVKDIILLKEYIKIYAALKPSFIFHYTIKPNIYGAIAAKICGIKNISITTGLGNAFSNKNLLFYSVKWLYKLSASFALEVWFLNSSDKAVFIKNNILSEEKSFVLPGEGVNTLLFEPSITYPKNTTTIFLLISRMLYDKGVEIFVKASQILLDKGYHLSSLLLGQIDPENPEAITLKTIEQWQKQGSIQYLGSTSDVKPYFENVHAVVLPSYYKEGIPRVLLEAACMQKPIITTRNPGCIEVVDDGINGFLCDIKSVADLADKMEKFIHLSVEEKEQMGIAGRKKVLLNFDETIIIAIYKRKVEQYL